MGLNLSGASGPLRSSERQSFCGAASLWLRKTFGLWCSQRPFHWAHETIYWSHYVIKSIMKIDKPQGVDGRNTVPMSQTGHCSLATLHSPVIATLIITQFYSCTVHKVISHLVFCWLHIWAVSGSHSTLWQRLSRGHSKPSPDQFYTILSLHMSCLFGELWLSL